jgi:hypothetical protein
MPLQDWVHHWGEGAGARALKVVAALLGFLALAALYDRFTIYDLTGYENFTSEEAMESAQLARNLAEGRGYTTDSIRPLALYLLTSAAEPGQSSKVLAQPVPDLTTPPVYPFLLAELMKALPFQFVAREFWFYQPERWISIFNQVLYFAATLLLFLLARRLFDPRVAWLAAALFAGTNLFWRFSISGLSTIWLILVFFGVIWFMTDIERRDRLATTGAGYGLIPLAILTGALVGVGGLSRYAFAWMIVPVFLYVLLSVGRGRVKLSLTMVASFLVVMAPWIQRNIKVSGQPFGTAGYAVVEQTSQFPDDTLERSTDPGGGFKRLTTSDIVDKLLSNAREMCVNEMPRLGGNWIAAFFVAGLLMPFRTAGLARLRWFVLGALVLFFIVQALVRTHVSQEAPEINSENLLVLLAPLVFIYGAALFHTLLDQLNLPPFDGQGVAVAAFVAVLSVPLVLALVAPRQIPTNSPYSPLHIQRTSYMMGTNEALMSDIPGGVAWYGRRSCLWLSLDDENEFFKVNAFKAVQGLFLTQVTTDKRFLSQMKGDEKSWGHFVLECAEHGDVPAGFPLRKAPVGLLPEQLFLSDRDRWQGLGAHP